MSKFAQNSKWKLVAVSKNTETFRRIQYSLKLSLRMLNGRFQNFELFQANSSAMNFDQRYRDKTTLECWVKLNNDDDSDQFEQNGQIQISPEKPKLFKAGTIIENADELQEDILYTFLLYKVAVGKSYCYNKQKNNNQDIILPQGYDSIYIEDDNERNIFQNNYLLFNKDSVLVTYVVQTYIKIEQLASVSELKTCSCGNQATRYCENDREYFCEDCDAQAHESSQLKDNIAKIMNSHKRVPIEQKPKDFEMCQEHPT